MYSTTMLCAADLVSAAAFNQIPTFEQQIHHPSDIDLQAIGKVFLQHHAHEEYCAALLHRHFDLRDNEVMVHRTAQDGDICSAFKVQDLNLAELSPYSLFLHNHSEFRPFELARKHRQPPLPNARFLQDLRALLRGRHLENVVCISVRPDRKNDSLVVETQWASNAGSLSISKGVDAAADFAGTAVVTNWEFHEDQGDVRVQGVKACVKNNVGVHEVKTQ